MLSLVQPSWDIQAVSALVSVLERERSAALSPACCVLAVGRLFFGPERASDFLQPGRGHDSHGQRGRNAVIATCVCAVRSGA